MGHTYQSHQKNAQTQGQGDQAQLDTGGVFNALATGHNPCYFILYILRR